MKYLFISLSVVFILFALVQLNDPDPMLWIAIYGFVSITCLLAARGKIYLYITLAFMVLCIVWAIVLFPISISDWWQLEEESASLKMKMPGVEEARESMGLLISALVLGIVFFRGRKINRHKA